MAAHVIVLANRTAAAPELIEALVHRGERGPIHRDAGDAGRRAREPPTGRRRRSGMNAALEAWKAAGVERCEGVVCDPVPLEALAEVWDPMRHDEVIVSTLPGQSSKWIRSDLPHAVARYTGVSRAARGRARPRDARRRRRPPRRTRRPRSGRSACWPGAGRRS